MKKKIKWKRKGDVWTLNFEDVLSYLVPWFKANALNLEYKAYCASAESIITLDKTDHIIKQYKFEKFWRIADHYYSKDWTLGKIKNQVVNNLIEMVIRFVTENEGCVLHYSILDPIVIIKWHNDPRFFEKITWRVKFWCNYMFLKKEE
ncbi:MAG: hypothetical protein LBV53_01540 [Mycoplasmataceae bacterium]|jgi:hypothetical protein|nr:hypothetical protein [Mycoplasmataceae bacterium]